jgi:hypothetical protein
MSLKIGPWKMNNNGDETTLTILSVDPGTGAVLMELLGTGPFAGLWDETSRKILFSGPGQDHAGRQGPQRFYEGFLFSTPRNPAPGQDVVWTLVGSVQITDAPTAQGMGGNARRNTFGWFAQVTEVA